MNDQTTTDVQSFFKKEGDDTGTGVMDREKVMKRVRGLIAQANGTNNPAEADAFRAKADALMLRFSIREFELQDDSQSSRKIEPHDYDMEWYQTDRYGQELWEIMVRVAFHCRVQLVTWKYTGATIPAVGTDADFEYFDMLFTNISLEMSRGIEPSPDPNATMIENLVRLKEAGMKWERIGELLIGVGQLEHYDRNVGVRFTKLYTDYCAEHNRPRLRVAPSVYQNSFVLGFKTEIVDRLYRIRRESERQYDEDHEGRGTELVLADIRSAVEARVKQLFGGPPPVRYGASGRGGRKPPQRKIDSGAMSDGRSAASKVDLGNRAVGTTRRELRS